MNRRWLRRVAAALTAGALLLAPRHAAPQPADEVPDELQGVGIAEHPNQQIPLDTPFVDDAGKEVPLRAYFPGDKPVILQIGYYRCPMLCGLVLNGLTDGLKELDWTAGTKFTVVSLSIDPLETPILARLKKQNYLKEYGRPEAGQGWHFLTGREKDIRAVTDAVGFQYKWNAERQEYAHAAAIFVLAPDGHLSRYLYGVMFPAKTLRLALLEASEGKIGTTLDKFILFCHRYDPQAGRYTLAALTLMRAGAFLTLIVLGTALLVFWRREARRRREEAGPATLVEAGTKTP